jgi:hypothetical protein
MPISITKSIAASSLPQGQCRNYSPNLNVSYWVAGDATISTLSQNATLTMLGYYDQAGYDWQGGQPMVRIPVTIPAASATAALASDSSLGTYLLTLPLFSGGTAAVAS